MTQVKCRSIGGNGMPQAAWKYAQKVSLARENKWKNLEEREAAAKAEARAKITLPRIKWLERPMP
jgi:hypothetical protein